MSDPKRWLFDDDVSPLGKRLLRSSLDVEPPPGTETTLWNAITARLDPGGEGDGGEGGPEGGSPPQGTVGGGAALKAMGAIGFAVVVGVAAYVAVRTPEVAPPAPPAPIATTSHDAPSPSVAASESSLPVVDVSALPNASSSPATRPTVVSSAPSVVAAPEEDPLLAEARAVRAARDLLRSGDGEGALRDLRAAAKRFPNGTMVEEREALMIEALAKTGRGDEARERAQTFLRTRPSSPLAPRVAPFAAASASAEENRPPR